MTCRCSAVGAKLLFLFYFLLLYSKAAVVPSNIPPPACTPLPRFITGNCFLSGTSELILTFVLSLRTPLLFWRNLVIAIIARLTLSAAAELWCYIFSSSEGRRGLHDSEDGRTFLQLFKCRHSYLENP